MSKAFSRHTSIRRAPLGTSNSFPLIVTLIPSVDMLFGFYKLIDSQISRADKTPKRPLRNLLMIWYRKSRHLTLLGHNDVATTLSNRLPTKTLENRDDLPSANER